MHRDTLEFSLRTPLPRGWPPGTAADLHPGLSASLYALASLVWQTLSLLQSSVLTHASLYECLTLGSLQLRLWSSACTLRSLRPESSLI